MNESGGYFMLSEVGQKDHMISLICEILRKNENRYTKTLFYTFVLHLSFFGDHSILIQQRTS
jgi:hypothetical protein